MRDVTIKLIVLFFLFFFLFFEGKGEPTHYMNLSTGYLTIPFGTYNDGKIYDHLNINEGTIEFWTRFHNGQIKNSSSRRGLCFWGKASNNNSMSIFWEKNFIYFQLSGTEFEGKSIFLPLILNERSWHHIAATWEKKEELTYNIVLYVDGKQAKQIQAPVFISDLLKRDIYIGLCKKNTDIESSRLANADMAIFRISKNVRYSNSFIPDNNYGIDPDTICFFPFSGNNDLKGFFYISNNKNGIIKAVKHEIQKGRTR